MKLIESYKQLFLKSNSEEIKENNLKEICRCLESETMLCSEYGEQARNDFLESLLEYKKLRILNPAVDFSEDAFHALESLVKRYNNSAHSDRLPMTELTRRRFVLGNSWRCKEKRISDYFAQIKSFENSDSMDVIINILNDVVDTIDIDHIKKYEDCADTYTFLKQFDSRRGERQQADVGSYAEYINEALKGKAAQLHGAFDRLGMIKNSTVSWKYYDYILIAGGGNDANLARTIKAKEIADVLETQHTPAGMIAALSTYRKISDGEKSITKAYAPGLDYEFDIISKCVEDVFFGSDKNQLTLWEEDHQNDPTMRSKVIEFSTKYGGSTVRSYCAPKRDPNRTRADTRDCLEFFFEKTDVQQGVNILLVTSNLYCTSQFAADIAIEHAVNLDIVGNRPDHSCTKPDTIQCASYLNELIKTYAQFGAFRAKYVP